MTIDIAVDIGGTFTDLVCYDSRSNTYVFSKSSSTPGDFSQGIFDCISKANLNLDIAKTITHGTTVVINAVIEGKGVQTALITTQGFRDVLEIVRGNRPESYNLLFRRKKPLVPREHRYELTERIGGRGDELEPIRFEDLEQITAAIEAAGIESVAVCLLNSYVNPDHESTVGQWLKERQPDWYVSLSHVITREMREYERTSSAVVNAYIGPIVKSYLDRLERELRNLGFKGSLFMMQSNGGVMTASAAKETPVCLVESGPVAGMIGAAKLGVELGYPNVIPFDMGGTTAKTTLIENGEPSITPVYFIGDYKAGYPVQTPIVDIIEVGAGGGSIAWIDEVGALKLGPHSAGADPGPVCYGRGGKAPTVTDANVVLGRINAQRFLGGEMALDVEAAKQAIGDIGSRVGLATDEVAAGILNIANVIMAGAVRRITVERGRDPRDFTMIAFGGTGPMHAVGIARELGVPRVIVPSAPAHFSAFGMLQSEMRRDYALTYLCRIDTADLGELEQAYAGLETQATEANREDVTWTGKLSFKRSADMRYVGQEHTVQVDVPGKLGVSEAKAEIKAAFDEAYRVRYGHSAPDEPAQIVNIRLAAITEVGRPGFDSLTTDAVKSAAGAKPIAERNVYFIERNGYSKCPIYSRETLPIGTKITGPAIIEEYASTIVLHHEDQAEIDHLQNIVIAVGGV